MLALLWLPDKMYLEYIVSAAFAYVGQLQILPPQEEAACCAEQIVV